jgi:hypothetical protein
MKTSNVTSGAALVVAVLLPSFALADNNITTRCVNDQANTHEQVAGRNAWALKCGYITPVDQQYGDATGKYATFSDINAPWSPNDPCIGGGHILGLCILAGCYTPDQRVMFGGRYLPIKQAALEQTTPTITALGDDWQNAEFLPLTEATIRHFVVGDEFKPVLRIEVANGFTLEVTDGHPMVDADGNVLPAKDVVAGKTRLLTSEGPLLVTGAQQRAYAGKVWNVEPESDKTYANVHLAEGFLTGSIRFQNEWANDASRLQLRRRLDISAF